MKNLGFGMMRLPVISGPTDFDYEKLNAMVDAFLEAGYTYFDTSFAEAEHVDFSKRLEKQTVITDAGIDITAKVEQAVEWLTKNTF